MLDEVLTQQGEQTEQAAQTQTDDKALSAAPAAGKAKASDDGPSPRWYVVHTYSGYENKVKVDLEKTVHNRGMQDLILEVTYPTYTEFETRQVEKIDPKTKKKVFEQENRAVVRKKFPGYVMVKMFMNPDTWYVVRNTRGVTGFVGPVSADPIPLTDDEVTMMGLEQVSHKAAFEVGDLVRILSGSFVGHECAIRAIDNKERTVTVYIPMFGKDTPLTLSFSDIHKIW